MVADFRPIEVVENVESFFRNEIEEKMSYLSGHARFYVFRVLSDMDDEKFLKRIHQYRESPLVVMLEEAESEINTEKKHYLYKYLGDTCMFVGGVCKTERVGDDILFFVGSSGYTGAARLERIKKFSHTYYELATCFGDIVKSLRKMQSPKRLMYVKDADLLRMYEECRDEYVLEELRIRGIVPLKRGDFC